jgi:signal transduction histidine kinase
MISGEELILIIEVVVILGVVPAVATAMFCVIKNRRLRRRQELLHSQLEIQERDFNNIYNQIHDNIGQILSLAKWNLQTVETDLPQATNEKIHHANELISKAIIDLRDLSKNRSSCPDDQRNISETITEEQN